MCSVSSAQCASVDGATASPRGAVSTSADAREDSPPYSCSSGRSRSYPSFRDSHGSHEEPPRCFVFRAAPDCGERGEREERMGAVRGTAHRGGGSAAEAGVGSSGRADGGAVGEATGTGGRTSTTVSRPRRARGGASDVENAAASVVDSARYCAGTRPTAAARARRVSSSSRRRMCRSARVHAPCIHSCDSGCAGARRAHDPGSGRRPRAERTPHRQRYSPLPTEPGDSTRWARDGEWESSMQNTCSVVGELLSLRILLQWSYVIILQRLIRRARMHARRMYPRSPTSSHYHSVTHSLQCPSVARAALLSNRPIRSPMLCIRFGGTVLGLARNSILATSHHTHSSSPLYLSAVVRAPPHLEVVTVSQHRSRSVASSTPLHLSSRCHPPFSPLCAGVPLAESQ